MVVCFEKQSHFHFQGAPKVFSCPGSGPSPFSIRPGMLPAHSPSPGSPSPPPGWEGGPGARRPLRRPPSHWRPKGLQERGWDPQRDRVTDGSVPGGEGTKRGSHGPLARGRRLITGAVTRGSFLSFPPRSPRCERGKPWAARTPGASCARSAAGRSAALTLNSPYALWLHSTRVEKLEV